jgi:hypothetical protein
MKSVYQKKRPWETPQTQQFTKPRSLSPMARRKKVESFSPATCAAEKIPLGLQTCALFAKVGQRVRCSQAANLFSKK